MAGRLGHIDDARRVGHVPKNGLRPTNYAYGFACNSWLVPGLNKTNTETNLAAISSWNEYFRNISFAQGTAAKQPRYVTSDANFNNLPVVDFYSTARNLICASNNIYGNTYAIVGKINALNTNKNTVLSNNALSTASHHICFAGATTGGIGVYTGATGGTALINSTVRDTNPHIVVVTGGGGGCIIVDGVNMASASFEFTSSFDIIGQVVDANTPQAFNGQVAEIISYNDYFTAAECIRLSDNINSKYAIY